MKTFTATDQSWFEVKFNHRLEFAMPRGARATSRFYRIKQELQDWPEIWGDYREDWICHIRSAGTIAAFEVSNHSWYFMDRVAAMRFAGTFYQDLRAPTIHPSAIRIMNIIGSSDNQQLSTKA